MVLKLFAIMDHVLTKFGQNRCQIDPFQSCFADSLSQLINLKDLQKNFALNFAKKDLLIILFFCS